MSKLKSAVLSLIGNRVLSRGKIVSNQRLAKSVHLLRFQSESLIAVEWRSGTKVQINVGNWLMRTYTPLSLDSSKGEMEIVAFSAGSSPSSMWLASANAGDSLRFKGPDGGLSDLWNDSPLTLFGDETSFGLAAGLKREIRDNDSARFFFEVSDKKDAAAALTSLGLPCESIYSKENGGEISPGLRSAFLDTAVEDKRCKYILSGRAQSIQSLRKSLLNRRVSPSQILLKVYWSEGRAGLD